jgi:hypothetical protein
MAQLKPEAQARSGQQVNLACASGFKSTLRADTPGAMNNPGYMHSTINAARHNWLAGYQLRLFFPSGRGLRCCSTRVDISALGALLRGLSPSVAHKFSMS